MRNEKHFHLNLNLPYLLATLLSARIYTGSSAMNQNLATKTDIVSVKAELLLLKWMVGLVIVVEVLPLLKVLFA